MAQITLNSTGVASSGTLALQSNGTTTAVTIDTSQNVGVGNASPAYKLDVVVASNKRVVAFTPTSSSGISDFSNGGVGWNFTRPDDGAFRSSIFSYNTAADAKNNFAIQARADMVFATGGDFSTSTERMRIDSSGNLLVGTTSLGGDERLAVTKDANGQEVFRIKNTSSVGPWGVDNFYSAAAPNNTSNLFFNCRDTGGARFSVRSNGGLANYSANNVNLSDRREKTNFAPAGDYLAKICAIPVQTFNYIDQNLEQDGDLTLGVVAQDVQTVAPELVMESNWAAKDEEPKMRLSIYQTDLQYALMKSIQELKALVDTQASTITALQADVAALKAK